MVTPKQSHHQSKVINSMDKDGFKKYYAFLLKGGTVEEFVAKVEAGVIKVKRHEEQLGTLSGKAEAIGEQ